MKISRIIGFFAMSALLCLSLTGCMQLTEGDGVEEVKETSADEGNTKKAANAAISFVEALSGDMLDDACAMVYIPQDAFVSDEDIKWYLPRSDYGDIYKTGKSVTDITVGGTSIEKTATVQLDKASYMITLKLGDDNTWKVDIDKAFVDNWSIKTPRGCTVTVDDRNIDPYLVPSATDESSNTYTFPSIMSRTHKIVVSSSLYRSFVEETTPRISSDTHQVICAIGEAETANILKSLQNIWNNLYSAYTEGRDVQDIRQYFVTGYDLNLLTDLMTKQFPKLTRATDEVGYKNFYMSSITPYNKNNYGAAILDADNAVNVSIKFTLEFIDDKGEYHQVNRISSVVMCYEKNESGTAGRYKIKSLPDDVLFTSNDYDQNDF